MLGQLFLLACLAAMFCVAGILFVLFGPVPVKRRITIVARQPAPSFAPTPTLVAQLAPAREQHFTPPQPIAVAAPAEPIVAVAPPRKPMGAKVQPAPRKRVARGTDSPFAPVVRRRQVREEDVATNPVRVFESEELTTVDFD